MKHSFKYAFLSFVAFLFVIQSKVEAQDLEVINVQVEQQSHPIGIATATPRFSWQISSGKRAVKQVAYEILVATSKANLEKNIGDAWSSGKISSDEALLIPYKGISLKSNRYYYTKIRVVTNKGEEAWSKPMFFTLGFVNKADWKAKWIGYDKAFPWDSVTQWSRLSARYYRKEFTSAKKLKKAFVNLVGLGMCELHINGKKMGDQVLAPAPTDYRTSVLSNTFDVTEHILSGKNAIGVVLGNGRFFTMRQNYKPQKINNFGFPKLLFQMDLIYNDGTTQTIISDGSWKFTADGPIRTNNEYDGEEYDATKELNGWAGVGYNDGKWLKSLLVEAPSGKVTPQPTQHMKVMQKLVPVSINKLKDDIYILDMGQNFSGWLQIKVKGKRGKRLQMKFAESLQPDGQLYIANLRDARVTDVYTLKGEGEETWHPTFVYHGFRYVEITGWPGTPTVNDFEGHLVYDQMTTSGTLKTSNEVINSIIKNAWWGIASNYKGMPVDCPQRNERQPWLGDRAQGAYGESFLFNNASLYAKWLDDIEESQTAEGAIPDVAPAYWNYYSDNVTWPGTYILVADMLHQQFGDQQSIKKHYPSMKKWLAYMKDKYMKNFIVAKDKYGDWCVPPEDLKMIKSQDSTRTTNGQLLATAYYYRLLGIMERFAKISGNDRDIAEFTGLKVNIKTAFNKKFFREQSAQYDNGTVTANLLPLYFGMIPDNKNQQVFNNIVKKLQSDNMHISTGVIGTQWLMRGLTQYGKADAAFILTSNKTYPSWGYMIENGATTIWELWNGNTANPQMNSQNHIMLLGDLLIWMFEDLGGIKAAAPGFKEIEMKPSFIQQLNEVEAGYKSAAGDIKSQWKRNGNQIQWQIEVPANSSAVIHIPAATATSIKEGGKAIGNAEGVSLVKWENGIATLRIGSGNYQFTN
ncbi:family 78 glycoside hydrolase catalytic domain [Niabella sp. 22666]|uniref:alpha-L-rhamnosidase n=1 Tax=Niabella sp. 22666 TaxID=3453954 RepID=UPI003F87145E